MAKARKGSKENPVDLAAQELASIINGPVRDYVITGASILDDFCNYSYEITGGVGLSNTHQVKSKHIILDDMRNAFSRFNVHLAVLDDAFKISGVEVSDVDLLHSDEITGRYNVTGFRIKGSGENEAISLIGIKYCFTAQGRMSLVTPFIPLDSLSSYQWHNELKDVSDRARDEVSLYHEGKFRMDEEEEDEGQDGKPKKRKAKQLTIASPEGAADNPETSSSSDDDEDTFEDFERAEL